MTTVTWPEVGLVARRRTSRPPASPGCCGQRHPLPSRPRESQRTVCPPRAQCLDAHRVHAACASSRSTNDRPPPWGPATPSHADDTLPRARRASAGPSAVGPRSEEHTSELQSQFHLVCRLLLEKKKRTKREKNLQEIIRKKKSIQ